jgi:hypothetical protein
METAIKPSATSTPALSAPPLGVIEKIRVVAAIGAAVVVLYTIGWMAVQPTDPSLAVTFVRSGRAIPAIWPAVAVLCAVAGIIGTVISGPRLPEAGLFAASIALAALSLHGGSMFDLMANKGATSQATRQAFMRAMAIDCALWAAIMFVTWIAVSWAYRWVWTDSSAATPDAAQPPVSSAGKPTRMQKEGTPTRRAAWTGWSALIVTGVIGAFVVWISSGREPVAPVHRGQTIAAVAGGLYLGAMGGRYFTGIRDVRWYLLAVPAVGMLAWLVGYLSADMKWAQGTEWQYYIALATTPTHDLARPLPIEYIAVGTAAVLAGYWGGDKMEQVASHEAT